MLEITSSQNALFKELLSLTESKGLKKSDRYLLSGRDQIQEFLSHSEEQVLSEIYDDNQTPQLPPKLRIKVSPILFRELDVLGTKAPLLVVKKPQYPTLSVQDLTHLESGSHLLLPLGDPGNLGAALRSAAAFGANSVILLKEAAHAFLPKTLKAAAGAHHYLKIFYGPSLQDLAEATDLTLTILDQKGPSLRKYSWPKRVLLLVGEEGAGLPLNLQNHRKMESVSIPTQKIESLNANVALSIALYELSNQG